MAESQLVLGMEYFADPTKGRPIFNGQVFIGKPGFDPEIEANRVSIVFIQENGTRVTVAPASQPLSTTVGGYLQFSDSIGVFLVDGAYSIKVRNNIGTLLINNPRVNETATVENEGVLVLNGSFENETQFSGVPDNWTLAAGANGTIAIDTTQQAHGLKSLKFTGADATGGGTSTSDKFNVLKSGDIDIRFIYKSSAVNTLNKVEIKYYDASGSVISTSTIFSEGAANPLVFTPKLFRDIAPATAVQAEIILTGVDGSGAVVIGDTHFDDVSVTNLTDTSRVGKSGDVIKTVNVADSVNEITVINSATGDALSISATGDDVDVVLDLSAKGEGFTRITGGPAGGAQGALYLLDDPASAADFSNSTTATVNWTVLDLTVLNGTGAKAVLLRIKTSMSTNAGNGGNAFATIQMAQDGQSGATVAARYIVQNLAAAGVTTSSDFFDADVTEVTIPLDSNQDFQYMLLKGGNVDTFNTEFRVLGFYV